MGPSIITAEDVQSVVYRAANTKAKIVSHTVEPFSKQRNGMMGNHYSLIVEFEEEPGNLKSVRFFAKTPPESPIMRDRIVDEWVSQEEVHFFRDLYPTMEYIWSPVCYLAKSELLVFEDLRERGFSVRSSTIYDEPSLKAVLSTLARFHASSFLLEKRLGKPLDHTFSNAFREKIFTDEGRGGRANKLGFETLKLLANNLDLDGSIVPRILEHLHKIVKPRTGCCDVVCHGDLWRNNIMFRDEKGNHECLLVDYQMLRYASPTVDFAMLLFIHTTPEFRRHAELKMLEYYYSVFSQVLKGEGFVGEIPDYKDLQEDYEQRRLVGMAYASMRWPPVVFKTILNDPEALENWYFNERFRIYRQCMDEDPSYKEQMKNYLSELFGEAQRLKL